jgi:predicted Ser/Thr protein kinase
MSSTVAKLLKQVEALSPEEKEEFRDALERRTFADLDEELAELRAEVAAKGITEDDINDWIAEMRYGKKPDRSK